MRCRLPFSALALSALRKLTCSRSMPTGLTTKSWAPARIADTTFSKAAMGGLPATGVGEAAPAVLGQHAHAVEAGHDEIEHHGVDSGGVRRGEHGDRCIAGVDDDRLIPAFLHH